jgi:hypothetical protein
MMAHKLTLYVATLASIALAIVGCDKSKDAASNEKGATGDYTQVDPATAATVTGKVTFEGTVPPQAPVQITDDACAAHAGTLTPEVTQDVVVTDGNLANVFVYVSAGLEGKRFATPADTVQLDQLGCRYHPHVLGMMVNQPLKIVNSDATLHNVHAQPSKSEAFNLAQPNEGMSNVKTFDHEEVMVPVSCDVHGWMRSYIGVMSNPFFAVTPKDGSFSLEGLPPGTYTVTAWHEKYGTQQQQVTVGPKESKQITFTFKAG